MTDKPLSEYIDMEAYDVVPASQYRELKEQLDAAQARIAHLEQSWQDSASMATYTSSVSNPASEPKP